MRTPNPSFVYRQDGYELSYEIVGIFYQRMEKMSSPRLVPGT